MKRLLSLLAVPVLTALGLGQNTDFLLGTNIDTGTLVVKHRSAARPGEVDEFHGHQGGTAKQFKHLNWSIVKLDSKTRKHTIDAYKSSKLFERVDFARVCRIVTTPNDPLFSQQWGMAKIQAPAAWDRTTSNNVIVAIIDTGIDFNHPDLRENLWTGPNGEHGYTSRGGNLFEGGFDDHFHGTHVAGIIGAVGNNGVGIAGLNWHVQLLALKFLTAAGYGTDFDAALCIEKMVDLKLAGYNIRVSNNSWGGGGEDSMLQDAFTLAEQAGILNICAAGNDAQNDDNVPFFPAGFPLEGIVSVLASDEGDNKASFSNYGEVSTDILAPGLGILSCKPGGEYQFLSGTSMASPHVAGVAAALFGLNPGMNPLHCKNTILNPDSFDQTQFVLNSTFGGRLNFAKAVANPYLFSSSNNHNPTLTLSSGTNAVVVQPGKSRAITAQGADEDGDSLRYSSAGVAGRHLDDWLIEKAVGGNVSAPVLLTNIIKITNLPSALDFGLDARFGVTDGKGGGAVVKTTFLTLQDPGAVRPIEEPTLSMSSDGAAYPLLNLTVPNLASNGYWTIAMSSGYQGYGQAGVFNVGEAMTLYRPIDAGPNLYRAYVMDTNGNFVNSQQLVVGEGYYPSVRIKVNALRGTAPFNVVGDMSETDPGNAHHLWYSARYWRKGGASIDPENPVRSLTLNELGLHPIEFAAYDTNSNLGDNYVVLFNVIAAETEPPPPALLIAPGDLAVKPAGSLLALSWTDAAVGEDRWELEYRSKLHNAWSAFKRVVLVADTQRYTFVPAKKTSYEFRVKCCKETNCSVYSNTAMSRAK